MINKELARIFGEIADLMEIRGEEGFRVNSYRRAARTFKDVAEDVATLSAEGRLTQLPGIGKGTAARVAQYLKEGKIDVHQELLKDTPPGLIDLLRIPGLGPKKVALMWHRVGVESIDDLLAAIDSGKLIDLPGMGAKSVENIRQGIEFLQRSSGRTSIGLALPVAQEMANALAKLKEVEQVELAGSIRRWRETVGDVDILCRSTEGKKVIDAFVALPQVEKVLAAGETKGSVLASLPERGQLQVDLRVVPDASFGAALQYFTGSKEHNVRLRERAGRLGLKLNEYGLFKGERSIAGRTEESVYGKLGLPWIPPEVREDRGELEAGDSLPGLVQLSDIRGDLHLHTPASDGRDSIEALAAAAKTLGYRYIAITEHSKSQTVANGLSPERMAKHIEAIRESARRIKGIRVLVSTEVDILGDGSLDYPDELLAECDIVTASIHSGMGQRRDIVTKRTITAMHSRYVHIIGHPTGRLIGQREAMDLDVEAVINAAVETGTALEINGSWQRLDLCDLHVRQAIDAGAMLVISTDGHSVEGMVSSMPYGVATARRGWADRDHILNTQSLTRLMRFVASKTA